MKKIIIVVLVLLLVLVGFVVANVDIGKFKTDWVEQPGCPNGYRYKMSDYCVGVRDAERG